MPDPFAHLKTSEEVRAAWRRLAFDIHPDRGGDPAAFSRLHRAYRARLDELLAAPCATCGGTRTVIRQRGFSAIKLPCPTCR